MSELRELMTTYPQILKNVKVYSKIGWEDNELIQAAIEAGRSAYLSGLGRVLERGASASDPLTGFLRD